MFFELSVSLMQKAGDTEIVISRMHCRLLIRGVQSKQARLKQALPAKISQVTGKALRAVTHAYFSQVSYLKGALAHAHFIASVRESQ